MRIIFYVLCLGFNYHDLGNIRKAFHIHIPSENIFSGYINYFSFFKAVKLPQNCARIKRVEKLPKSLQFLKTQVFSGMHYLKL